MDPFNEVKDDAWATISMLDAIISDRLENKNKDVAALTTDYDNNMLELEEIMSELRQAVAVGEANPQHYLLSAHDIKARSSALDDLHRRINDVTHRWHEAQASRGTNVRQVTTMSNRISHDDGDQSKLAALNQFQEQQYIQEQDNQLDSIHVTMRNLNAQAAMMGGELEEQGHILDELDYEIDTVGLKLQRGMRRVENVLERNRNTALNCCIVLLMVALGVLLVIAIAL